MERYRNGATSSQVRVADVSLLLFCLFMSPRIVCLPGTASKSCSQLSPHSTRRKLSVMDGAQLEMLFFAPVDITLSKLHVYTAFIFPFPGFRSIQEMNAINSCSCNTRSVLRSGLTIRFRKRLKIVVVVAIIIIMIITRNCAANVRGGITVMHCSI
jgi:hypothetical protein